MVGMLASLGIEKGKPFAPDPERAKALTEGVREAAAWMQDVFMNQTFVPFWPGSQWMTNKPESNFGYSFFGDGKLDYDRRAAGFTYYGTWAPKRLADPGKLPASFYLKTLRDKSGAAFRGDRLYRADRAQGPGEQLDPDRGDGLLADGALLRARTAAVRQEVDDARRRGSEVGKCA